MALEPWILHGLVKACRAVLKESEFAPLIGLFGDEEVVFSRSDRDEVWQHLMTQGVCCARVTKKDTRANGLELHTIVIARDGEALAAGLQRFQKTIAEYHLEGVVSLDVIGNH